MPRLKKYLDYLHVTALSSKIHWAQAYGQVIPRYTSALGYPERSRLASTSAPDLIRASTFLASPCSAALSRLRSWLASRLNFVFSQFTRESISGAPRHGYTDWDKVCPGVLPAIRARRTWAGVRLPPTAARERSA